MLFLQRNRAFQKGMSKMVESEKRVKGVLEAPTFPQISHLPEICVLKNQDKRFYINIKFQNNIIKTLIDTGATNSYLGAEYMKLLEPYDVELKPVMVENLMAANGQTIKMIGKVSLLVEIGQKEETLTFRVVPDLKYKAILGIDMIQKIGLIMDFELNAWWLHDLPNVRMTMNHLHDVNQSEVIEEKKLEYKQAGQTHKDKRKIK